MKTSAVLPVALASLLTASLAAPLALRYPSPEQTEKRADTFLTPKTSKPSFDQAIHETLNFGSGEPLLVKKDNAAAGEKRTSGALNLGSGSAGSDFSSAVHEDLNFNMGKRATGSLNTGSGISGSDFSSAIHEDLDFGGTTDPLMGGSTPNLSLFKRAVNAVKRATGALNTGSGLSGSDFSSAIHENLDFGGTTDPLMGGSTPSFTLFKKGVEGAAEKVANVFHA